VRYLAYGLTLESDARLPELAELKTDRNARADITVRLVEPPGVLPEVLDVVLTKAHDDGAPWIRIARTAWGYLISEAGIADFAVDRRGREVVLCRAGPGVGELTLRHALLDWVLALVLCLRGKQVLHASSIVTPDGLCAFAGPSGAGKSTLAASFIAAGYPVFCDDCLVVEQSAKAGCFECTPAYPGLRLWDDSVEVLGLRNHVTQSVAGYMPKHRVVIEDRANGLAAKRRPLARVYCLNRRPRAAGFDTPWVEPLEGKDALMELVSRSWMCDPTDKTALVQRFRFFASLAKQVAIRKLHVPDDIALLPDVRRAVLADLANEQGTSLDHSGQALPYEPRA
jgi:hypothetical protein